MTGAPARLGAGMPEPVLCFEDFEAGQVFLLGKRAVSRNEVLAFARRYDPQPFHIDEQAAQATILKGLAASGWHSCALLMSLLGESLFVRSRFAALLAIEEVRWLSPVRPGDVLSGRVTCLGRNAGAPRPGLGAVIFSCEALDGRGQRVMTWLAHCAFECRNDHGRPAAASPLPRRPTVVRNIAHHGLRFFQDVQPGDEIAIGRHRFSDEEIRAFNRNYDPWPAHPDAVGGRTCASGWLVAAVWMQRLVRYYQQEAQRLRAGGCPVPQLGPSPGVRNMIWEHPVYAGDVLTFTSWAERKLELPPRSGWGLLIGGAEASNQRGEVVVSFLAQLLLERRK